MRTAKAVIAGASLTLAAWVCALGCSNKTDPNPGAGTFGEDTSSSGSSGGGAGSGGGATSGSSGTSSGVSSSAPTADYADGGISCGPGAGCPQSEQCCYAAPTVPADAGTGGRGFGAFPGAAPALSCTAAGSCSGSSLSCSSTAHCSGGQVCCFAFQQAEGGTGIGGFGAPMAFTAECADSCPSNDMIHYQLCASAADCPSGQSCVPGTYTPHCADMGTGFPGGGTPGGPTNPQTGDDGGSD